MSGTPDVRAPAAKPTDGLPSSTLHTENAAGHASLFAQPATYLRPEPRTMESRTLTPLDKEQMQGLVCSAQGQIEKLAYRPEETDGMDNARLTCCGHRKRSGTSLKFELVMMFYLCPSA